MRIPLSLPKLNNNDTNAEVVRWLVEDGDFVEKGAAVADVESSKATVSIYAEQSGYILRHAKVGESVDFGAALASISAEKGQPAVAKEPSPEPARVQGQEPRVSGLQKDADPAFGFCRFSKAAASFIAKKNIDPKVFTEKGLITLDMACATVGEASPRRAAMVRPRATLPRVKNARREVSPAASALRRERLAKAKRTEIEYLTAGQIGNINSSLTVQFSSEGIRETLTSMQTLGGQVTPLILYEFARLLKANPKFTAFYEDEDIVYYDQVNIGLAIDLEKGLRVPVIRDADRLMPAEIMTAVNDYALAYLDDALSLAQLQGGTVTVSDLSGDDVISFQPLINERQAVILGIGGDSSQPGHPMTLTLVFDHRVLTGREVSQFLKKLRANLLSYELSKMPEAAKPERGLGGGALPRGCSRCGIEASTLYKKLGEDAFLHLNLGADGQLKATCHVCAAGM